jgi:hypothetical protein
MTTNGPVRGAAPATGESGLAANRTNYVLEHTRTASLELATREFAAQRVSAWLNEAHACS